LLCGKKAGEVKLIGGQSGNNQSGEERRRPRQRFHANSSLDSRSHHTISGIGNKRCAGIRDQGARFALFQPFDEILGAVDFVVFVVTEQTRLNSVVVEQTFGGAGILAGDPRGIFQDADRPIRDVLKVADGRRDYVEAARNSR
jgi:hypothetical protein